MKANHGNTGALLRRLRKWRFAAVFGMALLFVVISDTKWFRDVPYSRNVAAMAHNAHFQLRFGKLGAYSDVCIVGITSSSLDQDRMRRWAEKSDAVRQMGENTWPWPRSIHAQVIGRLFAEGAKVVAVDIAMTNEREGDEELVEVLKKYSGRIVLASILQNQIGTAEVRFFHPRSVFLEAAGESALGLVTFKASLDGNVVRRYDSHTSELREGDPDFDDGNHDLVHFAVRSAEKLTGTKVKPRYNEVLPFIGRPATFDYIPVEEIFMDTAFKQSSKHFKGRDIFRDKLVFYGPIAEIFHDVHATPLGMMPGVEIHAHLAVSLIQQHRILDASPWADRLLTALVGFLCAGLVLWIRNPVGQLASVFAVLIATFAIAHKAFEWDVFFPTVTWLFSGFAAGLAGIMYLFVVERMERAHVRKTFGRFVSKRIAEVVLKNSEEFDQARAGGRRSVAVLFSDIRSFTTWSESATPEHLVGQLNEYFEAMVPIIEDSYGNAQKFIGDAILAAWGDTHSSGENEDCRHAVSAALKMREVLHTLNAQWDNRADRIVISIGIGINHGTVVTGEVGHSERREFTVLGVGVNFAARLESATKQFHTDCLVGETVEQLTREHFTFREVGFLRVKGKTKPVHIFTPLGEKTVPSPDWLADYHKALALHRSHDFSAAIALFENVKQRTGGEDFLCDWYIAHARRYLAAPPSEDWDGSETLTEK